MARRLAVVAAHARVHIAPVSVSAPQARRGKSILSWLTGGQASGGAGDHDGAGKPEGQQHAMSHFVTGRTITGPYPQGMATVVFGTGCFWGTEKGFWRMPGVFSTAVGYTGGSTPSPTYEQVCGGRSGHNEVVQVVYDPEKLSFADLLRQFWESHDPTQGMGQGNDRGTQYRSGIYCHTADQAELAHASKAAYESALKGRALGREITTEIVGPPCPEFHFAEENHQQYLAKPSARQYCSAMPTGVSLPGFSTWCPVDLGAHIPFLPEEYWAEHGPKPGCTINGPNTPISW